MGDQSIIEQQKELFRQASQLSRREVLRRGLALGLSMPVIGYLLAACGGSDNNNTATSAATTETGGTTATSSSSGATATAASTSTAVTGTPDSRTGVVGDTPWYVDQAPGPPVSGGTVNYLLYEDPDSLNPIVGQTSMATQVSTAVLEGLARDQARRFVGADPGNRDPDARQWRRLAGSAHRYLEAARRRCLARR